MALSRPVQATFTCPRCRQPFQATLWQCVHAGERPDLLAAAAAESLNLLVCAGCGAESMASNSLLLVRPDARPRLLFVTAPGLPEPARRRDFEQIFGALVRSMGEAWQRSWDLRRGCRLAGVGRRARGARRRGAPGPGERRGGREGPATRRRGGGVLDGAGRAGRTGLRRERRGGGPGRMPRAGHARAAGDARARRATGRRGESAPGGRADLHAALRTPG